MNDARNSGRPADPEVERPAPDASRPAAEPLDPFEAAVAFAIRRAAERKRREAAERDAQASTSAEESQAFVDRVGSWLVDVALNEPRPSSEHEDAPPAEG